MSISRCFLLALAIAGVLLIGGCGGDDEDGAVAVETGSLSKPEFIKRADQVCERARVEFQREFDAYSRDASDTRNPTESSSNVVRTILLPNFQKMVDGISSIGAPKGDEEEISELLTSLQVRLDELDENPKIAFESLTPFTKDAKLARAYGLDGCADSLD